MNNVASLLRPAAAAAAARGCLQAFWGARHALRVHKHHAPAWIFYFLLIKYEFMNLEEPPSFSLIPIFLCKIIKK